MTVQIRFARPGDETEIGRAIDYGLDAGTGAARGHVNRNVGIGQG